MRMLSAAVIAIAISVVACGGDDTAPSDTTQPASASPSSTASPSPTPCDNFFLHVYKVDLDTREITTVGFGVQPAWSSDGAYIAYFVPPNSTGAAYCNEGLVVQPVGSSQPLFVLPRVTVTWRWSPDGHMIAAGGNGTASDSVTLISGIGVRDIATAEIYHGRVGSIAWSPDGSRLAFVDEDTSEIHVYGVETGQTRILPSLLGGIPGYMTEMAWSPTGDRLAAVPYQLVGGGPNIMHLFVVNVADGTSHEVPSGKSIGGVQWTNDGSALLFGDDSTVAGAIFRVSADGRSAPQKLTDGAGGHLSPDGSLIAFTSDPCGSFDIGVVAPDGSGQRIISPGGGQFAQLDLVWSPNSDRIGFFSDVTYTIAPDGTSLKRVAERMEALAWSPDGRYLAGNEVGGHGMCGG